MLNAKQIYCRICMFEAISTYCNLALVILLFSTQLKYFLFLLCWLSYMLFLNAWIPHVLMQLTCYSTLLHSLGAIQHCCLSGTVSDTIFWLVIEIFKINSLLLLLLTQLLLQLSLKLCLSNDACAFFLFLILEHKTMSWSNIYLHLHQF